MFPIIGVSIGLVIGSEFGHIALGSGTGALIGVTAGLGVLAWRCGKPNG